MSDNETDWVNVLDEVVTLAVLTLQGVQAGLQDGLGLCGRPGLRKLIPEVHRQLRDLDRRKEARRRQRGLDRLRDEGAVLELRPRRPRR
jgi:hypothetical protein